MWELMKRNNEEAHIKITELQGSLEAARAGSASSTAEEMQKKCEVKSLFHIPQPITSYLYFLI